VTTTVLPEAPETPAARPARWCWGTWLVMTAAALWLAFVVAHRLLSGRIWIWAVLDLVPPIAFAAVPVLLLAVARLARPARWRVVLLAGAALLLGADLSGVAPAAPWRAAPPAPPGAIRVMSWNTEFWDQEDDPAAFYRYLKAQDADVYLLQEYVFLADRQPRRIDDLARLRAEFPGYEIVAHSELVTLSRLPIVSAAPIDAMPWLSAATGSLPPPDTDFLPYWTTKTLRTDVRAGDRTVSLYNVHLPVPLATDRNPLGGEFWRIIREQHGRRWANLHALEADLAANSGPVVVAGDLNTTEAMSALRPMSERLADAGAGTLRSPYPATWGFGGVPLWRLDWAFTSADVRVHGYRFGDPAGLSDHPAQHLLISPS
jgi:endonuclease/exonuclease/phosphatase (EEP) superfamily protein YafD